MRLLVWAALVGSTTGCTYHLRVESRPPGASLALGDATWTLPADPSVPYQPFANRQARVEAPGHRPLAFRLGRRHVMGSDFVTDVIVNPREAFGDAPRRVIELRLVPEHGPAGTWTEDDVVSP